jgi:uncharacterized protein YbaR (Trm112 family)
MSRSPSRTRPRIFKPAPTPRFKKGEKVVIVLGAGATKACDGPLTTEILPKAFEATRGVKLEVLDKLLVSLFGVPPLGQKRNDRDYPALPTLLSLIDTAIDREHDLGNDWPTQKLRQVRRQAEYAVFKGIAYAMRSPKSWSIRCHEDMLSHIHDRTARDPRDPKQWPTVISFNYDLRIDYAMIEVDGGGLPDYGCDFGTQGYHEAQKFGRLYKLHGSMHWLYCPTCQRLELGVDTKGRLRKMGLSLAQTLASPDFVASLEQNVLRCPDCRSAFRAVMITPTSLKDYRNPHIASLWYQAERSLRDADRVVFVGYSLPWDDIDVIYLLKRGIAKAKGRMISVVEHSSAGPVPILDHEAGRRYQAVFGHDLDWQPVGFEKWASSLWSS